MDEVFFYDSCFGLIINEVLSVAYIMAWQSINNEKKEKKKSEKKNAYCLRYVRLLGLQNPSGDLWLQGNWGNMIERLGKYREIRNVDT